MAHGLLEILRYFFLALLWLFIAYAIRTVYTEGRRYRLQRRQLAAVDGIGTAESEEPPTTRKPVRLRVLEPAESQGRVYEVSREVTLGRASGCVVSLEGDSYASSLHARVFPRDGDAWIEDLGSTNGTYLNERRLERPARLRRGDRVRVGHTVLEVSR